MGQLTLYNNQRSHSFFGIVFAAVFVSLFCRTTVAGLRVCYYCNTSTSGLECLNNPSNVTDGEIKCKGYCTIVRKDYVTMPEDYSLISLQRSCEIDPPITDGVVVEGYFKRYFRSCKSYLCNVGSGIKSLKDIPEDPMWDHYTDDSESNIGTSNKIRHVLRLYFTILSSILLFVFAKFL